jgi:serine/threonine-protein kinase
VIGKTVAHYKITEKIGAGGMGEVYRAGDSKLGRDVALKMLPAAFAQDAERMARFEREAQVLASLNHPNIGAIYGLEERDDSRFLVLELIEGPTLFDRLTTGRVPLREALGIALQIAEAVEFAHESGVVHRDLKPANVKVMEDGRVKVLDFGLAKAMEDPAQAYASGTSDPAASPTMSPTLTPTLQSPITGALTAANVILGTAAYMSPEQARGKPIDKRADIWSFGVMLWEMLSGQRLFDGETVSDTLAAVLRKEPEWGALPADTPPRIRRLVRRCLERNPRDRLRDIGDARIAIEEVLGGNLGDDGEAPITPAPGPRLRALLGAGVLVAVAAALVAGWSLRKPDGTEPPLRKFVLPVPDVTAGIARGTTLAIAPDGSRVAYTSEGLLWVRDLHHLEPRALAGTEGAVCPFWSPDGEWVAYGSGRALWKIRATGGDPVALCDLSRRLNAAGGGVWMSNGEIVFCNGAGPLLAVSSQGGDPDTLLPLNPETDTDFHNVSGLPEDRGLLFIVHRKEGEYDRIDVLAEGVRRDVVTHEGQKLSRVCYSPSGHLVYHREPLSAGLWAVPFSLDELRTTGKPFLAVPEGDLPHVAGDGTLVYAVGAASRDSDLLIVDRTGNGRVVGLSQHRQANPALSPDGRRVAVTVYAENDDIWILDTRRGTQTRLTFDPGTELNPIWSPDGSRIYYYDGESSATFQLKMKAADGTGDVVTLGRGTAPCVTADGRFLFYSFFDLERSSWDIWYMPLGEDGLPAGDAAPFVATDAAEFGVRPSPDGRYVAYQSYESGQLEIYLRRFPDGGGKWQVTIDGGAWPRWSPGGDELFFMRGPDLYVVSVESDPALSLGTPGVLFSRAGDTGSQPFGWPDAFDVSGDGRFLIVQPSEADQEQEGPEGLVVAQNWFAEFRNAD